VRRRTRAARPLRHLLGVLLLSAVCLASCNYSTKRLTDFPSARTIAVLPFENTGFYRDLDLRLTQAVTTEIRARTSLGYASPASADLLLRGRMTAREWAIGLDNMGRVIQKRLEGWLDFEVVERTSGRVLRKGTVSSNYEFRPLVQGESLDTTGTEEWTRRIAEQVVQGLERGF